MNINLERKPLLCSEIKTAKRTREALLKRAGYYKLMFTMLASVAFLLLFTTMLGSSSETQSTDCWFYLLAGSAAVLMRGAFISRYEAKIRYEIGQLSFAEAVFRRRRNDISHERLQRYQHH